jgi:hypothetical protein
VVRRTVGVDWGLLLLFLCDDERGVVVAYHSRSSSPRRRRRWRRCRPTPRTSQVQVSSSHRLPLKV